MHPAFSPSLCEAGREGQQLQGPPRGTWPETDTAKPAICPKGQVSHAFRSSERNLVAPWRPRVRRREEGKGESRAGQEQMRSGWQPSEH